MSEQRAPYLRVDGDRRAIPFWYQTPNVAALAFGANTQVALPFDQDSWFIWQKITVFCDIAGAALTDSTRILPLVTVQLIDSGNAGGFMSGPVPIPALMGDGRLPLILPAPFLISPNRTLTFNFTNYSAATNYANLRVQLHGIKRFQDLSAVPGS